LDKKYRKLRRKEKLPGPQRWVTVEKIYLKEKGGEDGSMTARVGGALREGGDQGTRHFRKDGPVKRKRGYPIWWA